LECGGPSPLSFTPGQSRPPISTEANEGNEGWGNTDFARKQGHSNLSKSSLLARRFLRALLFDPSPTQSAAAAAQSKTWRLIPAAL
jgi:hypothetical protein